MVAGLRKTGIDVVGDVPWDTHFCMFYRSKEDLLSLVVPYIKAGLEDNEACIWVISDVVTMDEAKQALSEHIPDLPNRMRRGQLEILRAADWYTPTGRFDAKSVLAAWKEKAFQSRRNRFDGIRATGDTSWLKREEWSRFVAYESSIGHAIEGQNMLVLCSYKQDLWDVQQIAEVASTHEFSLVKNGDGWKLVEKGDLEQVAGVVQPVEE